MGAEMEDRLRRAFDALASTVDTEERPRRRRKLTPLIITAAAAAAVLAAAVFFTRPHPATPATSAPPTVSAQRIPFDLLTHCGVDEAKIGDSYFEADPPIIGSARSAPPGWDNPYQHGTMTLLSPGTAVFHDAKGHEVRFRARPGATAFKQLCD